MVVVIRQTIFKCCVPHVMPKSSGTNTMQENNFQADWLETFLENKFQKKCTLLLGGRMNIFKR
jgi:hypothetical protein